LPLPSMPLTATRGCVRQESAASARIFDDMLDAHGRPAHGRYVLVIASMFPRDQMLAVTMDHLPPTALTLGP
jgi:hypothetical protein